ncbi:MAG: serine/threonine protein kinase [Myxococcales bacterium]|jgi:serine/threonine-protein kinase|nr:serine/threonine protein kinase [Myxococcales bacterium]MBL0196680.1 serine/threonine protein kinase [Myxococcales bacterium]
MGELPACPAAAASPAAAGVEPATAGARQVHPTLTSQAAVPGLTPALPVPISPVPAHLAGALAGAPLGPAVVLQAPPRVNTGSFAAAPAPPVSVHGNERPITGSFGAVPSTRGTIKLPEPGTTLRSTRGEYVVTSVLGAGEFGAVFDCIGPFDQHYAVKVIRPANRPYAEVHAEWAREASRLMSLRHPNVVYIHDAFEQEALFYLALEKCEHSLKDMLGAPMQEGLVLELTRQLLAAVQFLHDNDVVHDDLHAGNVLMRHLTDRPVVKISDFGISHELRGMTAIRPNVVHHAIMAPEILSTGYTSKQSDLYQVGLLLFWMVTGASAIPPALEYNELVRLVSEGEPRRRAEAIGTPLGALIAKMLRRREAFRYSSAREVWADLRELATWKERQLFPRR